MHSARIGRPVIETMEPRCLLSAGAVAAAVIDGRLIVTGDNAQNVVRLDGLELSPGQVRVSGLGANTINGHYKSILFDGVTRGVRIELARGNDVLAVASLDIEGALILFAGRGNDSIHMDTIWTGAASTLSGGAGDDQIDLDRESAHRPIFLDAGGGADQITFSSSVFNRSASIRTSGSGDDLFSTTDCRFSGHLSVHTASGTDEVSLGGSTFLSDVSVSTGDGDDRLFLGGSTFMHSPLIDGQRGRDVVENEGISDSFDFRDGAQEWQAGFADYSPGQEAFRTGLEAVPPELAEAGTGFVLSGTNLSDDLFMFLKRRLTPEDGVVPGRTYQLQVTTTFASNAPSNAIGIGGPPGEAVFLRAGGTPVEPVVVGPDAGNVLRLNVDEGPNGRSAAASVVGNFANGVPLKSGVPVPSYIVLTRHHVHTTTITAGPDGVLWLLIGTDSGYEGKTSIYYKRIDLHLTLLPE